MGKLIEHIENLLQNKQSVTVPEFGTFIKKSKSAFIDNGFIHPASSKLEFMESYIDDGEVPLAKYIAKQDSTSEEDALAFILSEVKLLKDNISIGEIIYFGNLGSFSLDSNNNIKFHPETSIDNFGLSPIPVLTPINDVKIKDLNTDLPITDLIPEPKIELLPILDKDFSLPKEENKIDLTDDKPLDNSENLEVQKKEKKKKRKGGLWVFIIILIAGILLLAINNGKYFGFNTPTWLNLPQLQLIPDSSPTISTTDKPLIVDSLPLEMGDSTKIEIPLKVDSAITIVSQDTSKMQDSVDQKTTPVAVKNTNKYSYYIIVGSGPTNTAAESTKKRLELKGVTGINIIQEAEDLFRLSVMKFNNNDDAIAALKKFNAEHPEVKGAWIVRKRN